MDTLIKEYERSIQKKFSDIVANIYKGYKAQIEQSNGKTSSQNPEDFFEIVDINMSILKQESEVTTKVGRIMYKVVCTSLMKLAGSLIH